MRLRGKNWLQAHGSLIVGITTSLLALAVYGATLARDITWANYGVDGGDLITAVVTQGNPHPSGYPTYLLFGYLVAKLPLSPIALRFNLFSALAMATGAGFIAATVLSLGQKPSRSLHPVAIITGLTVAFSALVWSQATITEVYGLSILLCAAFLWALLTHKHSGLIGLLLGLTITTHLTGALLLPLALIQLPRKQWLSLGTGLALGLLPFVLLPMLSQPSSPVAWGDLDSISGWWWLVSGQLYRGYAFSLPPNQWLTRLSAWSLPFLTQFTWVGLPLILASFFLVTPEKRRLYGLLMITAVFYLILAFFYHTNDAIIFTLPAWLLLGLLLPPALQKVGWLALALPLMLLLINFQGQNLTNQTIIRTNAEALLDQIPDHAIVETPGDPTVFTLWYLIYGEEKRTDTIPVDSNLFAFDWYRDRLQMLYPSLTGLEQDDLPTFRTQNQQKRPYCFASLAQNDTIQETAYSLTCTTPNNS